MNRRLYNPQNMLALAKAMQQHPDYMMPVRLCIPKKKQREIGLRVSVEEEKKQEAIQRGLRRLRCKNQS